MSKFTSRQWIAIAGSFLLLTGLFFINRKAPPVDNPIVQEDAGHAGPVIGFDQIIKESEDSLPAQQKQLIDRLKNALINSPDSIHIHIYARLAQILDSMGQPIIAAYYTENLAGLAKSPGLWCKAGQNFYDYSQLGKGNVREVLIKEAQQCFNKSLKIDSTYADATIGLGECQVDLAPSPMVGIGIIESVLKKDSNNRNAQIAIGKLSIRSGQFGKAIYRFTRVLQIDPTYKDAYIFLAESYNGLGKKEEEIANLKKYRTFATDSATKAEIDKIINGKEQNDTTK